MKFKNKQTETDKNEVENLAWYQRLLSEIWSIECEPPCWQSKSVLVSMNRPQCIWAKPPHAIVRHLSQRKLMLHEQFDWPHRLSVAPPTNILIGSFFCHSERRNARHFISQVFLLVVPDGLLIAVNGSHVCVIPESLALPGAPAAQEITGSAFHLIYGHLTGICDLALGKGYKFGILGV